MPSPFHVHKLRRHSLPDGNYTADGKKSPPGIHNPPSASTARRSLSEMCMIEENISRGLKIQMRFSARKSVLLVMAISFVAMVTGISLQLHFSSRDHRHGHDPDKCSICQQLLTVPGKFIAEPETKLPDSDPPGNNTEFHSQSCEISFHVEPFGPRPPPRA